MCERLDDYTEFPARIIGGPTGNYFIECDVKSSQWAEYLVVAVANGPGGAAAVQVNGGSKVYATLLDYAGNTKLSGDNIGIGNAFNLGASSTLVAPMQQWERITDSSKRVYVRVDTVGGNAAFVTVRFRIKKLTNIPALPHSVHPDHMQQLNIARADATRQRLGMTDEIAQGEGLNAADPRAKNEGSMLDAQK